MNYYEILQVSPKASQAVIKMAYKALAMEYHPDKNYGTTNEDRMKLINIAYAVLSDPGQRSEYDEMLRIQREHVSNGPYTRYEPKKTEEKKNTTWKGPVFVVIIFVALVYWAVNSSSEPPITFSEPMQELPASGVIEYYGTKERVAPFGIDTDQSTGNFYIKIVEPGMQEALLTAFVQAGDYVEFDVPLGDYELRYAVGQDWYGEEYLFGPNTSFYRADEIFDFTEDSEGYNGWTVELYEQIDGNMSTEVMDDERW